MRSPISSTLLLTLSEESKLELMERIESFRNEVSGLTERDHKPLSIFQFSLLFFPKSRLHQRKATEGNSSIEPIPG